MAVWVTTLVEELSGYFSKTYHPSKDVDFWARYTCNHVAKLWLLRNSVVHERRILEKRDFQLIQDGITSLGNLRTFILNTLNPDLLDLEKKFASILEPVQIDEDPIDPLSQMVTVEFDWRRELDCYQNPVTVKLDDSKSDEASE